MMKNLKNQILENQAFQISDVYEEEDDLLTRELVSDNTFSFNDIDNIIIVINEQEEGSKWYFTLDFGSFEDDEDDILESIVTQHKKLVDELVLFIKQESGIDFSVYNFDKPEITIPEEGIIELSFQ